MNVNDETLKAYEAHADRYMASCPPLSTDVSGWLARLTRGVPRTAHILEIGSGSGRDADHLERLGYRVQPSDGALSVVAHLRTAGHDAAHLNVLTSDLGGPYDVVFANAVLSHMATEQCTAALANMRRAALPTGRVGWTVKHGRGSTWETAKLGQARYMQFWTPAAVYDMADDADLAIVDCTVETSPSTGVAWVFVIAVPRRDR